MRKIIARALNEAPTLVVLALTIAGVDQTDYAPLVEFAGAAGAFGTWLLVRAQQDGPVTAVKREKQVREAMKRVREQRAATTTGDSR